MSHYFIRFLSLVGIGAVLVGLFGDVILKYDQITPATVVYVFQDMVQKPALPAAGLIDQQAMRKDLRDITQMQRAMRGVVSKLEKSQNNSDAIKEASQLLEKLNTFWKSIQSKDPAVVLETSNEFHNDQLWNEFKKFMEADSF